MRHAQGAAQREEVRSWSQPLWRPSPAAIADSNMAKFRARVARDCSVELSDTDAALALVGRRYRALLADALALLRRDRGDRGGRRSRTAARCRARSSSPMARLNYAENMLRFSAAGGEGDAIVFWGEDKVKRRLSHAELHDRGQPPGAASARAGAEAGRPGRRLRAECAGGGDRRARRRGHRLHLVVLLAGFRRAGRARPLRPDRAQGADHRRRLLVRRQAIRFDRAGRASSRPSCRACSRSWCSRISATSRTSPSCRKASCCPRRWPAIRAGRSITSACRSTIRSSSCIPAAPPACRNASCTAQGGTLLQHLKEHRLHGDVQAGRPRVLLHHLRLDDVELAGLRRSPPTRPCCSTTARRSRPAATSSSTTPRRRACTLFGTSAKYIDACAKQGLDPISTQRSRRPCA